jgi:ribonuclease HI
MQLQHLWQTILFAKGFKKGFAHWVTQMLNLQVGEWLPCLGVAILIKDAYTQWYHANEQVALQAKQAIQKIELCEDWKHGGKIAFGKVKTSDLSLLTSIKSKFQTKVRRVAWPKEGKKYLACDNVSKFDPNLPITFQTQIARITQIGQQGIFLDREVHLLYYEPDQLVVEQELTHASPDEMHRQLFQAWNGFFQRDAEDELDRVPDAMCQLVGRIPQHQVASMPPIDAQDIRQALRCTKISSSRGSDGFSTLDLRKLPECLLEMLAIILRLIEQQGLWPQKWILAKTICLPKCTDAKTPFDIRPVTIMAKIYRLWGHIRGKQVTKYISSTIPPEIAGVCKRVSSDMIALLIASKIEDAHRESIPLGGIVIDLMKCYNTVPRGALLKTLSRLGVPDNIINAFRAMMRQMLRIFEIAQSTSDPQGTTTGIIEGCGFAIPSMLAISILAHAMISENAPCAQCAFFADNWSVCAQNCEDLQRSLDALRDVTRTLKMKVAPKKSWSWATTAALRAQCASLQVNDVKIPLVHSAHDLGMQQNYTKRQSKKTIKTRIGKAKNRLQVIKQAKIPKGMKKAIAASAGHACVAYAGPFQQVAPQDIHALRATTAAAIQCGGSGSNSYLACNAIDPSFDPEFKLLFLRFQLWKRFSRLFPLQAQTLHQKCRELQEDQRKLKGPGPVAALVASALQIGCRFEESDGVIQVANRRCHWMSISSKALKNLLQRAWISHIMTTRIQRKYFDMSSFDWKGNRKAIDKLTYYHRSLVAIYQTGRHITNDFLCKFLSGVENKCVLCGAEDSRQHRVFHCPKLTDLRPKEETITRIQRNWKETSWHFGLAPPIPDVSEIIGGVTNHLPIFKVPTNDHNDHYVFTDGTAFFNDVPELSIAASAAVEMLQHAYTPICNACQIVPGVEQNSFTGELNAVLLALNGWYHVQIFSDCQTVVDLLDDLINQRPCKHDLKGSMQLWKCISQHFDGHSDRRISICKVKAHACLDRVTDPVERWKTWSNDWVDKKAKSVIMVEHKSVYKRLEGMHAQVAQQRADVAELFQFIAASSDRCIRASATQQKERHRDNHFNPDHPNLTVSCQLQSSDISFTRHQFLAFPWGPIFLWRIMQWARRLEWPELDCPLQSDISMLELYMDYRILTNSIVPRNVFTKRERDQHTAPCYILEDIENLADTCTRTLGDQMMVWAKCLSWLHKVVPHKVIPSRLTSKAKSLSALGSSATAKGFATRPKLCYPNEVQATLFNYFNTSTGHNRKLNRVLDHPKVNSEFPAWPPDLEVPFLQRAKLIRNAVRTFPLE